MADEKGLLVQIIKLQGEHFLRYKVWVREGDFTLSRDWTFTLWGAKRRARRMIKEINAPEKEDTVVEEYYVES